MLARAAALIDEHRAANAAADGDAERLRLPVTFIDGFDPTIGVAAALALAGAIAGLALPSRRRGTEPVATAVPALEAEC